jgi:hypothetical protein
MGVFNVEQELVSCEQSLLLSHYNRRLRVVTSFQLTMSGPCSPDYQLSLLSVGIFQEERGPRCWKCRVVAADMHSLSLSLALSLSLSLKFFFSLSQPAHTHTRSRARAHTHNSRTHARTHTHTHKHRHRHTHVCMYTYVCSMYDVYTYVCMYVFVYAYLYVCMHGYVKIYMCVCVCVCVCVCAYDVCTGPSSKAASQTCAVLRLLRQRYQWERVGRTVCISGASGACERVSS